MIQENDSPPQTPLEENVSVFERITVLDFSTNIAGNYATMFLADHGAKVIKVESKGGDPTRRLPGFQTLGRGKMSFVLSPRENNGEDKPEIIEKLVKRADVVVVDLPPHRSALLGIDYETLQKINPQLIYLSVPHYGEKGEFVDRPYSPALIQAAIGMMSHQICADGTPTYLVLPLTAYGTGPLAAAAVAACLYARIRTSIGQKVEVSEVAGGLALLIGADRTFTNPHPMGSKGPIPSYRLFKAGDGKWFFLACANEGFFNKLMKAIEREDLIGDPKLKDAWVFHHQTEEIRQILIPLLSKAFSSHSRDYWLEKLSNLDIPAQPVLTRDEYFDSSYVSANKMKVTVQHPTLGPVSMMGVPLIMEKSPGKVERAAPLLGEHTRRIMEEFETTNEKNIVEKKNTESGGLLAGVKVLDLSAYIAGPYGARHLAMMGAEVIKVEPPRGDAFRSHTGFIDFNQGKKAISLDLTKPEAKEIFYKLAKKADIIIENFRPDVTERLGVDYNTVKKINPKIIYVSSPGYGTFNYKMRRSPAFDPLLQALSGAMLQQGGGKGNDPMIHTIPLNDVMTPCIYTFGVCSALYYREISGEGQRIHVSLAQSSLAIQAMEFTRYGDVSSDSFMKGGPSFKGPSACSRWYDTKDGRRIFVEALSEKERENLLMATKCSKYLSLENLLESATGSSFSVLAEAFKKKTLDEWMQILDNLGVPCNPVTPISGYWDLANHWQNNLLIRDDKTGIKQVGMLIQPSATKTKLSTGAPSLSQHAPEILSELGYSAERQQKLADIGAVLLPQ